jgi:hypothetical protein
MMNSKSILFAAVSCLLLASGCLGYEDPDQWDQIEAELAGDADEDGIPDAQDNCPAVVNPEQHDSNDDGAGDDCDFSLVPLGSAEEPLVVHVRAGGEGKLMPVAILANGGAGPVAWQATSDRGFAQVPAQGVVSPGQRHLLPMQLNTAQLSPGNHQVHVTARYNQATVIIVIIVVVDALSAAPNCTFDVSMHQARVTEGQGIGEGKLELRITGHANGDTSVWPSSSGSDQMKDGGPWETIDKQITTITIPVGTVQTISVDADVLELDSGTLGNDDFGTAGGTMTLECGTGPLFKTLTVSLFREGLGGFLGKVQVKFKAEQI